MNDTSEERLFHTPAAERLLSHLRDHYGLDATAASKASQHNDHVFRVDHSGGEPWIARVYPPTRPIAGVEGDSTILRFLERHNYPAERLAVDEAVSDLNGASILVTKFVDGGELPDGRKKMAMMGDLLGRLHALKVEDSVSRPGGAAGDDPHREGSPSQDLVAAMSFLDAVDTKVAQGSRELFERLREQVRSADAGEGLPEALLHGNLLHNPDHALLTDEGPVAINWKAAGRGPRLADLAYLLWGAEWGDGDGVGAVVEAYGRHIELTDDELDRLEAVMYLRPLYLTCFDFRRSVASGEQLTGNEWWWGLIDPDHIRANAAAARAALRQWQPERSRWFLASQTCAAWRRRSELPTFGSQSQHRRCCRVSTGSKLGYSRRSGGHRWSRGLMLGLAGWLWPGCSVRQHQAHIPGRHRGSHTRHGNIGSPGP